MKPEIALVQREALRSLVEYDRHLE